MRSRPEPGEGRSMTSTEKKVVGGLAAGAGLATLLAGGYALFKHFGGGDMNPPREAQPEDPAPDNVFMSPQVRAVIDKKLAVRRRPRKPARKASRRKKKRL